MTYKIFKTDLIYKEIQQKLSLIKQEKPIIDKYYAEIRAKIKPTIDELPPNPDENQLRYYLTNQLSPILKDQTPNFIAKLSNSNDLIAFYRLSSDFLFEVEDIQSIDSNFLYDLWIKYKQRVLNTNDYSYTSSNDVEDKSAIPVVQPIDAPYGIAPSGAPHAKRGRKPKDEKSNATRTNIIDQLKNSPLFKAKQVNISNVPEMTLSGHGIHKMHHNTLKRTVGNGIVGHTYVARR